MSYGESYKDMLSRTPRATVIAMALVMGTASAWADYDGADRIAPLFADNTLLEVTIRAPITTLMDVRPDEEYLEGTFSYTEADETIRELSLKLRTRGKYRRDKEHCDFAPIRLNFSKREVAETVFRGQDKLKLVTHCKTDSMRAEQLVAREYIAYRLLNELSDISYAVRMLRINYIDQESGDEITRLGFVIEDDEAVAARNNLQVVKVDRISAEQLNLEQQTLIHVFEYMIGNTEYSLVNNESGKHCCHNVDVLSRDGDPPYLPLPFDYDFSGLVNAPYAQPNPRYPTHAVRERYYKGICASNEILPGILQDVLEKRTEIQRIVDEAHYLSSRSRRMLQSDLDSFFDKISSPERVHREFVQKCLDREDFYGTEQEPAT